MQERQQVNANHDLEVQQLCMQLRSDLIIMKAQYDAYFTALAEDRLFWSIERANDYAAFRRALNDLYDEMRIVYEDIEVNQKFQPANKTLLRTVDDMTRDATCLLQQLTKPIITEAYDAEQETQVKLQAITTYQKKYEPETMAISALRRVGRAIATFCGVLGCFVAGAIIGGALGAGFGAWFGYVTTKQMFAKPAIQPVKEKAKEMTRHATTFFKPTEAVKREAKQDDWERLVFQSGQPAF